MVPGLEKGRNEAAERLHQEMLKIKDEMKEDKIQLIFLTSPHGYVHATDFLVYFHNVFEGFQFYQDRGEHVEVDQLLWPGNTQVAEILLQVLARAGLPVSPIILADSNYPFKVAWGETIPLSYIADQEGPQVVIFSLPMAIEDESKYSEQLFTIGNALQVIAESDTFKDINISLVISGDLSHKHDPNHEYGFDESAKPFDDKSVAWAQQPVVDSFQELLKLHETAASCGIYGMGIIQGLIDNHPAEWKTSKVIYECPSYFGMMVASWKPNNLN